MTEKGFIICRPEGETTLNGLEYLLDDKDEIWHFDSEKEATGFLNEHGINEEDIMLKYHAFCQHCAKGFFFDKEDAPDEEDRAFYVCPDCKRIIENRINNKH
ncbi:hypothetical protein [Viscerimonas tarda]